MHMLSDTKYSMPSTSAAASAAAAAGASSRGGRYDFEDGGTYCGEWEEGKAHGFGICTGPRGQGEYAGAYNYGFEVSGVYTIPTRTTLYEGQWQNGKKHGLGVEYHARYIYRGEWTQGAKGRYGVRQSRSSNAKFEGTWANGMQDGYGTETYADGGTYQGQWLRGMRHGYGIRRSVPFSIASKYAQKASEQHSSLSSLRSEHNEDAPVASGSIDSAATSLSARGGFVLKGKSSDSTGTKRSNSDQSIGKRRLFQGLRIKKQHSADSPAGARHAHHHHHHQDHLSQIPAPGSLKSSGSTTSCASEDSGAMTASTSLNQSFDVSDENMDPNTVESYLGEWKNDKRSGFGISERSDGLRYEGEWFNNKKYGYGMTTFKDGSKEEGKYRNNLLLTSQRRKNALFLRSSKLRERIDAAVNSAMKAAQFALQKSETAAARSETARDRASQADAAAQQARLDVICAKKVAHRIAPDFAALETEKAFEELGVTSPLDTPVRMVGSSVAPAVAMQMNHVGYAQQPALTSFHNSSSASIEQRLPLHASIGPSRPPSFPVTRLADADVGGSTGSMNMPIAMQLQQRPHLQYYNEEPVRIGSPTIITSGESTPMVTPESDYKAITLQKQMPPSSTFGAGHQMQRIQQPLNIKQSDYAATAVDYLEGSGGFGGFRNSGKVFSSENKAPPSQLVQPNFLQALPVMQVMQDSLLDAGSSGKYVMAGQLGQPSSSASSSHHSLNQFLTDQFYQYSDIRADRAAEFRTLGADAAAGSSIDEPATSSMLATQMSLSRRRGALRRQDQVTLVPQMPMSQMQAQGARLLQQFDDQPSTRSTARQRRGFSPPFESRTGLEHGSLPDIAVLSHTQMPLMSREEVSQLSSLRRQEVHRMREQQRRRRTNPILYLFHPDLFAWIQEHRVQIFFALLNLCLLVLFLLLLRHHSSRVPHHPDRYDETAT